MNGLKRFLALFIFSSVYIATLLFTGCSLPIGSLQANVNTGSVNTIEATPSRSLFYIKDLFIPANDVQVYGVFDGVRIAISVDQVVIKIIEDKTDKVTIYDKQTGYQFESEGKISIVISLGAMVDSYDIQVIPQETSNGGTGIVIIWPD
jgi:hypothetical protein